MSVSPEEFVQRDPRFFAQFKTGGWLVRIPLSEESMADESILKYVRAEAASFFAYHGVSADAIDRCVNEPSVFIVDHADGQDTYDAWKFIHGA